jgi:hypothetical protein
VHSTPAAIQALRPLHDDEDCHPFQYRAELRQVRKVCRVSFATFTYRRQSHSRGHTKPTCSATCPNSSSRFLSHDLGSHKAHERSRTYAVIRHDRTQELLTTGFLGEYESNIRTQTLFSSDVRPGLGILWSRKHRQSTQASVPDPDSPCRIAAMWDKNGCSSSLTVISVVRHQCFSTRRQQSLQLGTRGLAPVVVRRCAERPRRCT